jgi:Ultra-violet resistance protein B/UvrB/uvrC motif/Helicase conserved C-terminal domain
VFGVVVGINLLREGIDLPEVTLVAILDADKEGFLRSAWSLIQMSGRAARNIGGVVIMYADRITDSMRAAIDEMDRRRVIQEAYNVERGIEPSTIVKGIRDLNDQLRTVAEGTVMYTSEREARDARLAELDTKKVEELVARMEAEMRSAAKQLEFERAAALRDEIQQIRLRVLDQDQSAIIARAAELAAQRTSARSGRGASTRARQPVGAAAGGVAGGGAGADAGGEVADEIDTDAPGSVLEVASVTVLSAGAEPGGDATAEGTPSDWLPGIRDEHEDSAGWQARWLDRPTWDRTVTPNIRRRQGTRPPRRRR